MRRWWQILPLLVMGWAGIAEAMPTKARTLSGDIGDGMLCGQAAAFVEKRMGLPKNLLRAVGLTESGMRVNGTRTPWPWTINVHGKGYRFNSKAEAIAAVVNFQRQGKKVIDIGCFQVNIHYHPEAFSSLEEAFDPLHNAAYAGSFLRALNLEMRDWKLAVAAYHSRNHERGSAYQQIVYKYWDNAFISAWAELKLANEERRRMRRSDYLRKTARLKIEHHRQKFKVEVIGLL